MKRKVCAILLTLGVVICQLSPSAMTVTEVRTGKSAAEMMTETTAEEIVADNTADELTVEATEETTTDDAADELAVGAAEEATADNTADELTVEAAEDEPTTEESSEENADQAAEEENTDQTPGNEVIAETADSPQETDSSNTDLNREETETSSVPEEDLVGEEAKDCSIYFSPDDASVGEMPDITVKAGTEYVLPECAYTCEGATFYMWNTSLGNKQAGDTIIVEEDVYVHPLWAEVIDRDSSPQDLSMTQVMGKLILTDKATGEVYTYTIDPGSLLNLSSYTYITKSTFDEPSNEIVEEYIEDIKESLKFHADQYLYKIDYTDFYHLDVETLTVSDPEIIDSKIYTENDTSYSKHWEDTFYTKTPIYPGDYYKLWQYTVTLEGEYSSSYPITVHWSSVDGEDLMEPLVFNLKTGSSFRNFEKQTSFFVKDGYVYSGHLLIWPLDASDYSNYSDYEYYYSSTLTYSDIATGVNEREYVTKPLDLYCIMLKEVPAVELTVEPPASEAEIRRIQDYKKYSIDSLSGVSAPNITVDTSECYAYINYYDKNDSGNDFGRWEREDSEYLADKNINEQDLLFYTGVSPKPGYIFTEDVQVTVNGATVQSMDLGTLWIRLCGSIAVQDSVKEDANACAISFTSGHSDSTGEMPAVTVNKGTEYVLPECAFIREDSAFYCWKVNGEEKQVGDTITVEQDTLLTAIWYYDVERDENPRDLSTTQVIAQLNLKDTKTGKVYTRTIDSCNEDDPNSYHYYYIDFITNSTFDDPYNSEVRQSISELKYVLQEYWMEFFDSSLLPPGSTLLLKNLDVSLPEILETKEYKETTYTYEPAKGSDDYMRTTFIPGDYYNKWRYTVTLDAEYSDYASVTVHWSSVDGEDMMEPFVITAALNTQLSTLEDQIPTFVKDGYIDLKYYTLISYSEATSHEVIDDTLDNSHDDFEEMYLENNIDIYCIMRKILPEAEITVSIPPCGTGIYRDDDEIHSFDSYYGNPGIKIETYECIEHLPSFFRQYESHVTNGTWIDENGEQYYGDFIGGQEYFFTTDLEANLGYGFSEDTKIIINNGTFQSMTITDGNTVDICGSVTVEHRTSEAVEENIVEPTGTENGSFDLVIRCKGCGEIISSESFVINAPGNDWNEWNKSKADTNAEEYTIFFGAAGSHAEGEMPSVTVKAGTEYVMPACAFTCDDADFYMWHTTQGNKHVGDTITVNENIYVCPLWAEIAGKEHTAQDLSMTRIVGQLTLTDKTTGEVTTETFDPGTLLNPTYDNAAGLIKSTFDEPSNASVEKYIKSIKDKLRETAEDISGYDNYNYKENGTELDIKKFKVSDLEIIESKTSSEKDASPQKQSMSSEYLRDLIYPEDYYNIWQYTVTLEAEYYSLFPVTVHWSSVDGEDLMDPVVFNIAPGERLERFEEKDPLFVKEGYIFSGFVKCLPLRTIGGDSSYLYYYDDRANPYASVYKPMDIYYYMFKAVPEIELTIDASISEKDFQQVQEYIRTNSTTYPDIDPGSFTLETPESTETQWGDRTEISNYILGYWDKIDSEQFTVENIGEQDLTFYVEIDLIPGYFFTEDVAITINGGTFHSMGRFSDESLTIYCSMTAKIDNDPAPPEAESTPTPKPSYTEHDGEHSWDEGVITLEPTWMETGVKTYTCTVCGETKTEEVPALIDKWAEWGKSKDNTENQVTYRNTGGDGGNFKKGESRALAFTFESSASDSETISHFKGIRVDGNAVIVSNYIVESGSVVITLKMNYLETLEAGRHTLTAVFDDGEDVTVGFTVEEAEEVPTGLPTIPITGIPENTEKTPTTVPTGTVTTVPENTQELPTGLPTIPITGIPENTEKTPTTVPTGTVTTVPENTQELPTGLPTIPITGIPENTQESKTTAPARTVTNTSSGTQKAPARTSSSRTTANTANTSGSAQKAPTRAATRAAATGDNNQIGVWALLCVAALATLIGRRPGRKNN